MSAPSKQEIRKVVLASLLGATIEWYDFFLYGVVAGIVFNKLFFPTTDPFIGTILAYSTFAIGYLARPLGGFVFGHFGDKLGRKSMLVLTMLIMGLATIGIGLVPTYAQIGIAAPIILQTLRLCQGLGLGGEWGGAVLMTYEYASKRERAFYASIPQMALPRACASPPAWWRSCRGGSRTSSSWHGAGAARFCSVWFWWAWPSISVCISLKPRLPQGAGTRQDRTQEPAHRTRL